MLNPFHDNYLKLKEETLLQQQRIEIDRIEHKLENGLDFSLLYYLSQGDPEINANCSFVNAHNENITCRHLAFEFLLQHRRENNPGNAPLPKASAYQEFFSSQEKISQNARLMHNWFDQEQIPMRADSYYFVPINDEFSLGKVLSHVCASLKIGQDHHMLLYSENHVMAIVVRRKAKQGLEYYALKFYDPNSTLVHKRIVCESLQHLECLSLNKLLSIEEKEGYFSMVPGAILALYQDPNAPAPKQKLRELQVLPEFPATELFQSVYHLLYFGFYADLKNVLNGLQTSALASPMLVQELPRYFAARRDNGAPGLLVSLEERHKEAVEIYMNAVLAADPRIINARVKKELLAAIADNDDRSPGFLMVCQAGYADMVKVYMDIVLGADERILSTKAKKELLLAKTIDDVSAFSTALHNGHVEVVKVYMDIILVADERILSDQTKKELLLAETDDGAGFFMVLERWQQEIIKIFVEMLSKSKLAVNEQEELLLAKNEQGVPWISFALQHNNLDAIHDYAIILFKNQCVFPKLKRLLQEAAEVALHLTRKITWNTVHWLGMCCDSAHAEIGHEMILERHQGTPVTYLCSIYLGLQDKNTRLAKNIKDIFSLVGKLHLLEPSTEDQDCESYVWKRRKDEADQADEEELRL